MHPATRQPTAGAPDAAPASASLRYSDAPQRRDAILRRLHEAGYISAAALASELAVSVMTVRRDLRRLATQRLVRTVHGGASLPTDNGRGSPYDQRAHESHAAKAAIATAATAYLPDSVTVGLDSGTTVTALARLLRPRDLTVVTHSLPALSILEDRDGVTLLGLGGLYQASTRSFGGPDTSAAIAQLRLHTLFLSTSAIGRRGVCCATPYDAQTKQALIAAADRVVLLADATKLRASAPILVCGYPALDAIITDERIDASTLTHLRGVVRHVEVAPLSRTAD
ncbi:MAG: DeoR/GlpR family DNA-binding transcription regulator [Micromonosporaceae bacterium]